MEDFRKRELAVKIETIETAKKLLKITDSMTVLVIRDYSGNLTILDSVQPFTDSLNFTFED